MTFATGAARVLARERLSRLAGVGPHVWTIQAAVLIGRLVHKLPEFPRWRGAGTRSPNRSSARRSKLAWPYAKIAARSL